MTTKHTPGPWGRNIKPASKYPTIYAGPQGKHVHVVHILTQGLSESEIEGNCDLVYAAPDLLAALKAVWKMMETPGGTEALDAAEIMDGVQDAIAKAEGR